MEQRPNAGLTPRGREALISRVRSGVPVSEAARQMGVSRQTAGKWLAREQRGEGLARGPVTRVRYERDRPHSACGACCHVAHRRRKQPIGTQHLTQQTRNRTALYPFAQHTESFTYIFDNDKISSPNTIVMTKINSEWRRYHGAVRIR